MTDSQVLLVKTFATNIVAGFVRQALTVTVTIVSAHWHSFDRLFSPLMDPTTITVIVASVTAFLMAIASSIWTHLHANKMVAKALDEAAAAAATVQGDRP